MTHERPSTPLRSGQAAAAPAVDVKRDEVPGTVPAAFGVVQAVVFDMDGLLLNTEVLARRGLRLAGAEVGLELDDSICELMIGVPVEACRRLLLDRFGEDSPADHLLAAAARHLRKLIDGGSLELKPGVRELLACLDHWNLPRALATSSTRDKALHHLRAAGIEERFDTIVARDDVARGKPFPDIYLRAACRLRVPVHACLALEDSYNGVRAAAAAGVPVIMVPDLLPPTAEMRQKSLAVAVDLHEVVAWLQRSGRALPPEAEAPGTPIASINVPQVARNESVQADRGLEPRPVDPDAQTRHRRTVDPVCPSGAAGAEAGGTGLGRSG